MEKYCPNCGIKNNADSLFCKNCGNNFSGSFSKEVNFKEPTFRREKYTGDIYCKEKYKEDYPADKGYYPGAEGGSRTKIIVAIALLAVIILLLAFLFT